MIRFSAISHRLHFKKPAATSRGALVDRDLWLIEARTSASSTVVGVGEAGIVPGLSVDDLPDLDARLQQLLAALNAAQLTLPDASGEPLGDVTMLLAPFRHLLAPLPALHFGIETALLQLLHGGGDILFPTPFTAGATTLATHGLIWMDTPSALLAQVQAKIDAGFTVIKMKVGAAPWQQEVALLTEIRSRFPQIELRLDANCALDEATVLQHLEELAPLQIAFLEEPIRFANDARGRERAQELCAASPIPLALDETLLTVAATRDYAPLLDTVRPPHVILKPSLLGGLAQTLEIIAICDELGIAWWINSLLESAVGHSAICQLVAATGDARVHGLGTGSLFVDNFPSPIRLEGARLHWQGTGAAGTGATGTGSGGRESVG